MSLFDYLTQIYVNSPDWIKLVFIFAMLLITLGLPTIVARFIINWRALSLSREELYRAYSDHLRQFPTHLPKMDDDTRFPLAKPEDYQPFLETRDDKTPSTTDESDKDHDNQTKD